MVLASESSVFCNAFRRKVLKVAQKDPKKRPEYVVRGERERLQST